MQRKMVLLVLRYFFEFQISELQISERHFTEFQKFEWISFRTDKKFETSFVQNVTSSNNQILNAQNFRTKIGSTRGYFIVIGPNLT
jgi:hypothetical protein